MDLYILFYFFQFQPLFYPDNSPTGQKLNVEEKKVRLRNESSNNVDRSDRERNDRGASRTVSGGGVRNSGDRSGPMNRTSNTGGMMRSGGGGGGNQTGTNSQRGGGQNSRPFNRNDRQQTGPRGNNPTPNTTSSGGNGGGGYQRR